MRVLYSGDSPQSLSPQGRPTRESPPGLLPPRPPPAQQPVGCANSLPMGVGSPSSLPRHLRHSCGQRLLPQRRACRGLSERLGKGTAQQEGDPAVTEEDGQGRGLSDPGSGAFIQPQGAHGKLPFLQVTHGAYRQISTSTPQKVRPAPGHTPLAISHHSSCSLHSCATGRSAHDPEAPESPGLLRKREPGGPWGTTCGSDLGPDENSA